MPERKSQPDAGRSPFGELLLEFRTRRGLTQESLSQATRGEGEGVSYRSITNYERSATSTKKWMLPHLSSLKALSNALDLDMVDQHTLVVAWNTSRTLRDADQQVDPPPSSFISGGRESAILSIMEAWSRARDGKPQTVLIGGISGIGKTAITRHACEMIAETENTVMIVWGGGSSWAVDVEPYMAVRTATDQLLVGPETPSNSAASYPSRPTLSAQNVELVMESIPLLAGALVSERALKTLGSQHGNDTAHAIDSLIAARSSTETMGRHQEFTRLLVGLSQSWPIVLVLEDLHWSGDRTAALLLHTVRYLQQQTNTPILIICTYRNDEVQMGNGEVIHPFNRLLNTLGHTPHVQRILLNESMSSTAGMAFVRGLVERTPMISTQNAEDLAVWLHRQTSGHPLLTIEMLHHLKQTGALSLGPDARWEFDADLVPANVPSAISMFMDQRLSHVSRHGRRILDIASAMDDVILPEIIAEITEVDEEEVLEVISQELIETHQLLLPGNPVRLLNQWHTTYGFPHALFREHIYDHLRDMSKKRIHRAIALAMEKRSVDADTTALSEITSHYMMAEDWHSAQMAGYRLAQHTAAKLDWDLAKVWFKQAEELAIRAQDPAQLWRTRAASLAVMRGTGEYDDALKLGEQILSLADIHNSPDTLALTYHHLGEVFYDLGRVDQAVEYITQANKLHMQHGALDLAVAGEAMLSHATYRQGKYDVARKHAQIALQLGRERQNSWVIPEAMLAAANCELDLGYYEQAIQNYKVAQELAVMLGKLQNQFIPAMNIGLSHTFMGNHQQAIDELTSLIAQMDSLKIYRLTAPGQLYLGFAHEGAGNWEDAAAAYAEATRIRRNNSGTPAMFDSVAGELRVAMHLQQNHTVRKTLEEITSHLDEHGWEGIEYPLRVFVSVARAHDYLGNHEEYERHIRQAHTVLMERARMIEDTNSRESFLTNVPDSIEIVHVFRELNKNIRRDDIPPDGGKSWFRETKE